MYNNTKNRLLRVWKDRDGNIELMPVDYWQGNKREMQTPEGIACYKQNEDGTQAHVWDIPAMQCPPVKFRGKRWRFIAASTNGVYYADSLNICLIMQPVGTRELTDAPMVENQLAEDIEKMQILGVAVCFMYDFAEQLIENSLNIP